MENKALKVLVIEDDPNYFILVNERLSQNRNPSFELIRSKHMQSGLERLGAGDIDVAQLWRGREGEREEQGEERGHYFLPSRLISFPPRVPPFILRQTQASSISLPL